MSSPSERPSTTPQAIVAGVAAILVVLLGVYLVQASFNDNASKNPGAEAQAGQSTATSSESSADDSNASTNDDAYLDQALTAAKDGYPAMIPAEVPSGWTAVEATYETDQRWHLALTSSAGGEVTVDQSDASPADLVTELHGSLTSGEPVNLKRYGTGTWQSFSGDGIYVLATALPSSVSVVVSGPTKIEVLTLTKQLLTAEIGVVNDSGSVG